MAQEDRYSLETVRGADSYQKNFFFLAKKTKLTLSPEESLEQGRNASRQLKSIYCHMPLKHYSFCETLSQVLLS